MGDGGDAGVADGAARPGATVVAIDLICLFGEEYRGLLAGLGIDGRLLEMISSSGGDPVRSITSGSLLLAAAAGREGVGIGLDREPLAKAPCIFQTRLVGSISQGIN